MVERNDCFTGGTRDSLQSLFDQHKVPAGSLESLLKKVENVLNRRVLEAKFGGRLLALLKKREVEEKGRLDFLAGKYGVLNKAAGDELLQAMSIHMQSTDLRRRGEPNAVLLIYTDANRFKVINDQHGQRVGDEAIAELGMIAADSVRKVYDAAVHDGGDEYYLVVPVNEEQMEGAIEKLAEDIIQRHKDGCELLNRLRGEEVDREGRSDLPFYKLEASYGVAIWRPGDEATILQVKDNANKAMKQAKPEGSSRR